MKKRPGKVKRKSGSAVLSKDGISEDVSALLEKLKKSWSHVEGFGLGPEVALWSTLMALGWHEGQEASKWQLEAAERFLAGAMTDWDL